jgi:hypothetical protein
MIFIDSNFKCYTKNDNNFIEVYTDFFNDKCKEFVEGYRFVPDGQTWTREDGEVFIGEMITPWKPYAELDAAQRQYEKELLSETQEALDILFGEVEA